MLLSDVIYLVLTVQNTAVLRSKATKKHQLFQYRIEPGHNETYKVSAKTLINL